MRELTKEKAKVIQEYEKFRQLFIKDRVKFESEASKAVENIISKVENKERKNNLIKLQEEWKHILANARYR